MTIRALLVDDEELARYRMKTLLECCGDVQVVGEAENGDDALDRIANTKPDLVFLDIQMPGLSGLEVASLIPPPRPLLVYCTAYDEYALRAFELHALDYLLKPVSRARLEASMERIREALDGSRRFIEDFEGAGRVQSRLYPQRLPSLATLEFAGHCRPVRWVSGDYYDFVVLDEERIGFVLADVSGKGVSAGLLMAGLQGRVQSRAREFGDDVCGLATWLNQALCDATESDRFVTFFYGVYDDRCRRLTYVNAGHNAPLLLRAGCVGGRQLKRLTNGGMVLGVVRDTCYHSGAIDIGPHDRIVLFSDGITEVTCDGAEEFGEERLASLIGEHAGLTSGELLDRVFQAVEAFGGGRPVEDDQTLILATGLESK